MLGIIKEDLKPFSGFGCGFLTPKEGKRFYIHVFTNTDQIETQEHPVHTYPGINFHYRKIARKSRGEKNLWPLDS